MQTFVIDISIRLTQCREIQFSLVSQSCPTLCHPMDCSKEIGRVLQDKSKEFAPSLPAPRSENAGLGGWMWEENHSLKRDFWWEIREAGHLLFLF